MTDSELTGPRSHPQHGELAVVRILRFPVPLFARTQEHTEELIRELTLIAQRLHEHEMSREVPGRLVTLIEQLTHRYAGLTTEQDAQMAAAVEAGQAEIDEIVFHVPLSLADASRALGDMLDEADEFCRRGEHLLTLATPPDQVRFRRWYLDEFVRQLSGEPPTSWPDYHG